MDLASDVDFNPRYNIFAVSGFGHRFPILLYVYERSDEELSQLLIMGKATTCFGPSYLNKMHTGGGEDRELMHPPRTSNTARKNFAPDRATVKGGAFSNAYGNWGAAGFGKENEQQDFNFSKGNDSSLYG
jgi:hypothetical protein